MHYRKNKGKMFIRAALMSSVSQRDSITRTRRKGRGPGQVIHCISYNFTKDLVGIRIGPFLLLFLLISGVLTGFPGEPGVGNPKKVTGGNGGGEAADLSDVVVANGMHQNQLRAVAGVSGAIDHLPFESDSVDCVIAIEVMEHVRRPADAFASVYRALKPGGSFILTTPNPLSYALWIEEGRFKGLLAGMGSMLRGRVPAKQSEVREIDGVLERYLTPEQLVDFGRAAGFSKVRHRSVGIGLAPMPYYRAENRRWPLSFVRAYERFGSRAERLLVYPGWLPWGKVQRVTCIK